MTLDRSARVVRVLADTDPEFAELVGMLYGPDVDAEAVWADVFGKAAPDPVDLAAAREARMRRERTVARVGLASNVLGIAAGTAGLAEVARRKEFKGTPVGRVGEAAARVGERARVPSLVRRIGPRRLAYGALGLQAANLGGDFINNRIIAAQANQQPRSRRELKAARDTGIRLVPLPEEEITKFNVARGARGLLRRARARTTRLAPPDNPPATGRTPEKTEVTRQRGKAVGQAVVGTPGKLVAGGTVAGGGYYAGRQGRSAQAGGELATGLAHGAGAVPVGPGYPPPWLLPPQVAGAAKRDAGVVFEGEFSKLDDDQQLAFGWASVVEVDGRPVVDKQGDYISPEDIEQAAYSYVLRSRRGGDMHKRADDGDVHQVSQMVESFVVTPEKVETMGLPPGTPLGWWVGFKITDPEVWQEVKKGGRTGFSIHGHGRRVERPLDEVMGWS